jgi:hypothetical protein
MIVTDVRTTLIFRACAALPDMFWCAAQTTGGTHAKPPRRKGANAECHGIETLAFMKPPPFLALLFCGVAALLEIRLIYGEDRQLSM